MRVMTVIQLRCFYEVSTAGSFSKAAERLYMSQSSMSKYIGQLEQELGIILFSRQGKSKTVVLTHEGKKLLPFCRSVLLDMRQMCTEASKLRQNRSETDNTIRMCGVPTMSFYGCIKLLNAFTEAYPQYEVILTEASESDVYTNLQIGACDIAFCSDLEIDEEKYQTLFVTQEGFRAAMARKHWAFSDSSGIMLSELRDIPLVLNRPESMLFDLCRDACLTHGFEPNVRFMSNRQIGIMEYLCGHPYCYVGLSRVIQRYQTDCIRSEPIIDHPTVNFLFCWNNNTATPVLRKFVAFAQEHMPVLFSSLHPSH